MITMIIEVIVCIVVIGLVILTLALNTKSEGLGAAITGASDSYRGAVGVEEQKRRLLQMLGYGFMILAFFHAIANRYI
jgi:protein translocase SecG subunit